MLIAATMFLVWQAWPDLSAEASKQVDRQECRLRDGDEIVVCARRGGVDRYRLREPNAPFRPEGEMESVLRERMRWIDHGDTGIQSCGPVGPGGWTGCLVQQWRRDREQSQWGSNRPKSP